MKKSKIAAAIALALAVNTSAANQQPNAEVQLGVAGYFQMFKYKTDENREVIESTKTEVAPYQKNLILNQGLDYFLTSNVSFMTYCRVGSGSSTPAFTNTALQSQIGNTATVNSVTAGTQNSVSPYYGWVRRTYRFIAGTATGNISEVGIGAGTTTQLFSRALILDGVGSPTTITVLSDEVLDVVYEVRNYVPTADVTGSMALGVEGGTYTYNLRAIGVDASGATNWNQMQAAGWAGMSNPGYYYTAVSTTQLSQVSSLSAGMTAQEQLSINGSLATYTNGNYYRDLTIVMDLNFANHSGSGFGRVSWNMNNSSWCLAFGSVIPKTSSKKFTMVVRYTVARV